MTIISRITVLFLGICALTDIWKKRIWWPLAVGYMILGIMVSLFNRENVIQDILIRMLLGVMPGIGLLLLSLATREAIGYGDGMIVAACGTVLGLSTIIPMLFLAFGFAAIGSVCLIICKKAGRKDQIPFAPFLLLAQICLWK